MCVFLTYYYEQFNNIYYICNATILSITIWYCVYKYKYVLGTKEKICHTTRF